MKAFAFTLVVLLAVCGSQAFYTSCGGIRPVSVASPNCGATTCSVTRGGTLSGTLVFDNTASHTNIRSEFSATIGGQQTVLGGDPVCTELTPTCPITAGQRVTWQFTHTVATTVPVLSGVPIRSEYSLGK